MRDNRGMTLIELVVAIAILSVVIFAITTFYVTGVKGFARESSTANNQTEIKRLSNEIAKEIRRSKEVSFNPSDGKLTLVDPNDKTVFFHKESGNTFFKGFGIKNADGTFSTDYELSISKRINVFDVTITGDKITVTLESIENSEGETYSLETELYIRN